MVIEMNGMDRMNGIDGLNGLNVEVLKGELGVDGSCLNLFVVTGRSNTYAPLCSKRLSCSGLPRY